MGETNTIALMFVSFWFYDFDVNLWNKCQNGEFQSPYQPNGHSKRNSIGRMISVLIKQKFESKMKYHKKILTSLTTDLICKRLNLTVQFGLESFRIFFSVGQNQYPTL